MSVYDPNYVHVPVYALFGQKAIILNSQNKILLMQRSDKLGPKMQWSLPGGAIDKGEDPEEGIRREIREEAQIEVDELCPFTSRSYMNDEDFVIILGYISRVQSDDVVLNWEHLQYKWLTVSEAIAYDLTNDARYFMEKYQESSLV